MRDSSGVCVCVWSLWSVREWTLRIRWRLSRSYIQGTSTTPVGFHCVFYFLVGYHRVQLSRGPEDIWTHWWGLCHWKWLPLARNKVGENLEHIGKDLSSFRKISGPVPIWALLHWTPALSVNTSCRKMPFPSTHPEHLDPSLNSLGPPPSLLCRSFSHLRLALRWISLIRLWMRALCCMSPFREPNK